MSRSRRSRRHNNLKPGLLILIIPIVFGVVAGAFIFSSRYQRVLSAAGAARLTTKNWQTANKAFAVNQPVYERKFAYYKVQPGQTLASLAVHYGVSLNQLTALNPGAILAGTTVKIPPIQQPLRPLTSGPDNLNVVTVHETQGSLYVDNIVAGSPQARLTIPSLQRLLQPYNAIVQTGPKQYRLTMPLYIEGNIRLDVTDATVSKLELKSGKNYDVITLTFRDSEALFENTAVTTFDPATNQPDLNYADGRSFVRAYGDGRMDIIKSQMSYLGMSLNQLRDKATLARVPFINQGGIYGVSWRIPTGTFGQQIATGWVEDSTFDHNHIGSFTFGASGMTWQHNLFTRNDVYGLDPHDDSNNALVTQNTFSYNGKHGFIVSKRCDYNIIENNVSYGNKLHGFMLHQDSAYNLVQDNVAYDNTDNYVIFHSNFNEFSNNVGYHASSSDMRINAGAMNNYIVSNTFSGGLRGIYLYDNVRNTYIKGNVIQSVGQLMASAGSQGTLFIDNSIPKLNFKLSSADRIIFGPNSIEQVAVTPPQRH